MNETSSSPSHGSTDWRTVVTALFGFISVATVAGTALYSSVLVAVDARLAAHSQSDSERRSELIDALRSEIIAVGKQVGQLEYQCQDFRQWRTDIAVTVGGLSGWKTDCFIKMGNVSNNIVDLNERVERLELDQRQVTK